MKQMAKFCVIYDSLALKLFILFKKIKQKTQMCVIYDSLVLKL